MDILGIALQADAGKGGKDENVNLTWWNVAFASLFIIVNSKCFYRHK
jgi:hypothetical protein